MKVLRFIFEGLSVFMPSVQITRHNEALFRENFFKNFWDNDVSNVNLSLKRWQVFPFLWDLRCNSRLLICVFMWRHAGGEIQAGRRQRRRGAEKQSEESRQRTAAHRHHQETVGLRVCAGKSTSTLHHLYLKSLVSYVHTHQTNSSMKLSL